MRFCIVATHKESLHKRFDDFLKASIKIHGNAYDYSLSEFKNANTKITIRCKLHDKLFEQRPFQHRRGQGCPDCGNKKNSSSSLLGFSHYECIVSGLDNPHPFTVSCDNYTGVMTSLITLDCSKHGKQTVKLKNIINNIKAKPCPDCNKEHKVSIRSKAFIAKARELHGDTYDYSLVVGGYTSSSSKVKIICREHGIFEQKPNGHLDGKGCRECAKLLYGRWSTSRLDKNKEFFMQEACNLYLVKIHYNGTSMYKVGITKDPEVRFRLIERELEGCSVQLISNYKSNTYDCVDREHLFFKKAKAYRSEYPIKFGGYTECLQCDVEVIDIYNSIIDKDT